MSQENSIKKAFQYQETSSSCFWRCGPPGTMFNTWWTCTKVHWFWIRVHALIYTVPMVNIVKNPRVALLNGPITKVSKHAQTQKYFMFLGAKITIATEWKGPVVDLAVMKQKWTWIMLNKKLGSILKDQSSRFDRVGDPWIKYLQLLAG